VFFDQFQLASMSKAAPSWSVPAPSWRAGALRQLTRGIDSIAIAANQGPSPCL